MNKQDDELRKKISRILTECRKEKGVTQEDIAQMFDASFTTVSAWEQGRSLPSIQTLYSLSKFYGKSIGYMYGEEDE